MNDRSQRHPTAAPPLPSFVLLTDAPPLREGGHGCHILAWNWIEAMADSVKLVVTHRLNPALSRGKIASDVRVPVFFYGDLSGINFPRCLGTAKSILEVSLFLLYLIPLSKRIRASGAQRLFAFFGGNPWFLCMAGLTARWTGLPLDVYLVDDLEESARLGHHWLIARLTRWLEPRILRRVERVFVISHGYVEHLQAKYRIASEWLPIPFRSHTAGYHAYRPTTPDIRRITFLGGVNPLYLGALRELLQLIGEWNRENNPFQLRLLIMTYSDPGYVERELGPVPELEILFRASTEECRRRMRESWAVFLPNSFAEDVRAMVSTSFPSKLAEAFTAGRPILVCGPSYASVPRYFHENDLPLCACSVDELHTALREIEQHDNLQLIEKYEGLVRRFHSSDAIRNLLRVAYPAGEPA